MLFFKDDFLLFEMWICEDLNLLEGCGSLSQRLIMDCQWVRIEGLMGYDVVVFLSLVIVLKLFMLFCVMRLIVLMSFF